MCQEKCLELQKVWLGQEGRPVREFQHLSFQMVSVRKPAQRFFENYPALYLNKQVHRGKVTRNNTHGFLGIYVFIYEQDRMQGPSFL